MANKRLVMLAGRGQSTNILFHAIDSIHPINRVIIEEPVPKSEFLKRRVKRLGIGKVIGQALFQTSIVPLLKIRSAERLREIIDENDLDDTQVDSARVINVESVNSDRAIEALKSIEPDLVLINGTRIISESVLTSIPAPFINIHAGITPLYRGVHGAYWALVQRDAKACGVTVHLVDKGIDTGGILAQSIINPGSNDNFVTYPLLQLSAGILALKALIPLILEGKYKLLDNPVGSSRLWSHPTLVGYLKNRILQRVR